MKSALQSFFDGKLTPQEFAVLATLLHYEAENGKVCTNSTQISSRLHGKLNSRAVARALRNLHNSNWIKWDAGTGRTSTITVVD